MPVAGTPGGGANASPSKIAAVRVSSSVAKRDGSIAHRLQTVDEGDVFGAGSVALELGSGSGRLRGTALRDGASANRRGSLTNLLASESRFSFGMPLAAGESRALELVSPNGGVSTLKIQSLEREEGDSAYQPRGTGVPLRRNRGPETVSDALDPNLGNDAETSDTHNAGATGTAMVRRMASNTFNKANKWREGDGNVEAMIDLQRTEERWMNMAENKHPGHDKAIQGMFNAGRFIGDEMGEQGSNVLNCTGRLPTRFAGNGFIPFDPRGPPTDLQASFGITMSSSTANPLLRSWCQPEEMIHNPFLVRGDIQRRCS